MTAAMHASIAHRAFRIELDLRDSSWPGVVQHAFNQHLRGSRDRVELAWPAGDDEPAEVTAEIHAAFARIKMGERTSANNGARSGRNFLRTLLRRTPWYPRGPLTQGAWAGRPAFVVGAGPSLDVNVELLARAREIGPVIANQTSAKALLACGIEPTIVVCVESVDCTYWLGQIPRAVPMVVKATAHTGNFGHSDHVTTFVNHEGALAGYAAALQSVPLPFSTSVAAASASLAIHGGCSAVVLVGMDLAFTGGRCYAAGTRVEDLRVQARDGLLHYSGDSETRAPESARYRDGWGGGPEVVSNYPMDQMALWFERVAQSGPPPVINATEGGSRIAGAKEGRLRDVLDEHAAGFRPAAPAPREPAGTAALIAQIRAAAERTLRESPVLPPSDIPLLNLWTVGASHTTRSLPWPERMAALREATAQGAQEVLDVLEGKEVDRDHG